MSKDIRTVFGQLTKIMNINIVVTFSAQLKKIIYPMKLTYILLHFARFKQRILKNVLLTSKV